MAAIDARAIAGLGIPRLLLMDHAGLALARATAKMAGRPGAVVVCCGLGYNGGDGLSAARHLHAWGFRPRVILTGPPGRLREEPAVFARILRRLRVPMLSMTTAGAEARAVRRVRQARLVVDALLGIGGRHVVRGPAAALIEAMNCSRARIVSADVPSGLDADTGRPLGQAVRATVTVAFGGVKRGCLAARARPYIGRLVVEPISIPPQLLRGHA